MFRKILIANRGEIAVRILRACRGLRIPTVAVFSDADRSSLHVRLADEALRLGPAPARESYLDAERVIDAARRSGADAIHPGYGFLSENAAFARACAEAGLVFIGPSPESIAAMGSKTAARARMRQAGVPVTPGTTEPLEDEAQALAVAADVGYPVMLKASAGGGGKGMRLVDTAAALPAALDMARAEAQAAFGDPSVYLEKAIVRPRHIEVQVLADAHGNIVHLGERECSLQRRHQKVVEETPSPLFASRPEARQALLDAAVEAARAADYVNAGTVEFLADQAGNFYFLEMNTRLQVEHAVTELVTGVDMVVEQIRIAAGEPLGYAQSDIRFFGSAIECRVYAEDPDNGFLPAPAKIRSLREPAGPGVRIDSAAFPGWDIPLEYDPLIAKLCAWAPTRDQALDRLRAALYEYRIVGPRTTLPFFRRVIEDPAFRRGELDTGFIQRFLEGESGESHDDPAAAAAAASAAAEAIAGNGVPERKAEGRSPWKVAGRREGLR